MISRAEAEQLAVEIQASRLNVPTPLIRMHRPKSLNVRQRHLALLRAMSRMSNLRWNRARFVRVLRYWVAGGRFFATPSEGSSDREKKDEGEDTE